LGAQPREIGDRLRPVRVEELDDFERARRVLLRPFGNHCDGVAGVAVKCCRPFGEMQGIFQGIAPDAGDDAGVDDPGLRCDILLAAQLDP